MVVPQSSPPLRRLPAFFCVGVLLVGNLAAQAPVRIARETFFLKEPNGLRLATLVPGELRGTGRERSNHTEVTINGWIFTESTKADRRDGFDLSVSPPGGEYVRQAPDGALVGRAVMGALFDRVGVRGGWTQVRRTGWVARSALTPPPRVAANPPARESTVAAALSPATPAAQSTPTPPPQSPPPPPAPSAPVQRGTLRAGATLAPSPEGAASVTLTAPADVTIGERDRDWVKVQISGWVRAAEVSASSASAPAITAAMLRENPDRYVGQSVDWRLQFLAHQHADELRPEMRRGSPYLLARGPLPETGFVYVQISPEQAERLKGLKPLDEMSVMVTIRAARTRYLATPVVELVRLAGESRTP
jgi:hypothetical protein